MGGGRFERFFWRITLFSGAMEATECQGYGGEGEGKGTAYTLATSAMSNE